MRKIIASEMVTLDGYFAGLNGEIDWFFWNDEIAKSAIDLISTVDTLLFVFKRFTGPELYAQWPGPGGLTMTIETFEPRKGGSWRYIQQDANGNEFAFHVVDHEVTSPERSIRGRPPLVRTNVPGTRKDIFMGGDTGGVYG